MASISIYVTGLSGSQDTSKHWVNGSAYVEGMDDAAAPITWNVEVPYDALSANVNDAIKDAAISQAELLEYTIGALDKKTLYGAAVGL